MKPNDASSPTERTAIRGFHAHVYFRSPEERTRALALRRAIAVEHPSVLLGRVHDRPIVVHPAPMYQVSFPPMSFGSVVPWLMLRQNGLSILVHAVTKEVMAEHRDWPLWLGERLELSLERLASVTG